MRITSDGKKCILVTGASTGIGRSTAEYLAEMGYIIYAGARKNSDLKELDAVENVKAIKLDVTNEQDINNLTKVIEKEGIGLFAVINNAGIAVAGPLMDIETDEIRKQFEVNLIGIHSITKAVFPYLLKSKGRIIMISSDSEFFATPFFGPYCASKHALGGYSDSLRRELLLYDVKVIKIQPGRTTTAIWDKGEQVFEKFKNSIFRQEAEEIGRYAIRKGKTQGMDPIEVAKLIYKILNSKKPKTSYLIAPSTLKYRIIKILSEKKIDKMVKKELSALKGENI